MDLEAERKKFEAWASGFGLRLKQANGTYVVWQTFCAWESWQAAVARCESFAITGTVEFGNAPELGVVRCDTLGTLKLIPVHDADDGKARLDLEGIDE